MRAPTTHYYRSPGGSRGWMAGSARESSDESARSGCAARGWRCRACPDALPWHACLLVSPDTPVSDGDTTFCMPAWRLRFALNAEPELTELPGFASSTTSLVRIGVKPLRASLCTVPTLKVAGLGKPISNGHWTSGQNHAPRYCKG